METRLPYDRRPAACRHRFLTPVEASEFLGGINSRTVTRWAREGYLPAFPVGEGKRRLWRFLESDLEAWMLSRRTGKTAAALSASTLLAATDAPTRRRLEGE
ncbi:MAG TPA: helix-turn-helix domain-containing protein [Acidisarcina sp.]|nr:helix-turn-helix domain-containing protein [Acidisarcina sp.]